MSLLVATLFVSIAAWAFAAWVRPRGPVAWWCAFVVSAASLIVVASETVGRLLYTPSVMMVSSVVAGAAGVLVLLAMPAGFRGGPLRFRYRRRLVLLVSSASTLTVGGAWLAGFAFSLVAVSVLAPDVADVLRYHMPNVVEWVQNRAVGIVPEIDFRASYFPHAMEILSAWTFLFLGGDRLSALPHSLIAGLLWPAACYLGFRLCGVRRELAVFTSLVLGLTGPVVVQMRSEMVDVGFFAAFFIGLFVALGGDRFYERPGPVVAVAAGFAMGAKISGVIAVGVIYLAVLLRLLQERSERYVWRDLPTVLASVVVSVLIGGWVFADNLMSWGNPVYPFAQSLGFIEFPGPPPYEPLAALGILNFPSVSFSTAVAFMLSRWPALLLGLPPFDGKMFAGASGFGWAISGLLLASVVLAVLRLSRGPRIRAPWTSKQVVWILVGLLAVWSVLLLGRSGGMTFHIPTSPVDARYQLHLPWLIGLAFCCLQRAAPCAGLARWVVVLAAVGSLFQSVYDSPHRGYRQVKRVLDGGQPRDWPVRALAVYSTPEKLAGYVGPDDALIVAGSRGRVYPFYGPDFSRRLFMVDACGGPESRTSTAPDLGPEMRERVTEYVAEVRDRRRTGASHAPAALPCLSDYAGLLAERYDVGFLVSSAGRSESLEATGRWTLLFEDPHPTRTDRAVALYRRADLAATTPVP